MGKLERAIEGEHHKRSVGCQADFDSCQLTAESICNYADKTNQPKQCIIDRIRKELYVLKAWGNLTLEQKQMLVALINRRCELRRLDYVPPKPE